MEGSRDLENVERELKPIRYQSETYSKVTSIINRVNVASLWDAHEHQKRGKAVVSTLCTWFSRETPNKKRPPRRSFSLRQSQWATA